MLLQVCLYNSSKISLMSLPTLITAAASLKLLFSSQRLQQPLGLLSKCDYFCQKKCSGTETASFFPRWLVILDSSSLCSLLSKHAFTSCHHICPLSFCKCKIELAFIRWKKSSSAPPSPVIKHNGHRKSGVDGIGAAVFSRWDVNLFPSSGERRTADNLVWKPEYNTT